MLSSITRWIEANPVLFTTVVWPTVTFIVLWLFKPRTPEAYAAMNPRVAGFLKLLSGSGLDVQKALEGLRQVITGQSISISAAQASDLLKKASVRPPPPPPPPPDDTPTSPVLPEAPDSDKKVN